MEIKAIETEYNGYKFRSRLEARWAVFFDAADIKYEYEHEGFELEDGTKYLPDFYFPEYDWYAEVKPQRENADIEIEKASKFVGKGIKALVLLGNIPEMAGLEVYHVWALYWNELQQEVLAERVCFMPALTADSEPTTRLVIGSWLGVDHMKRYNIFQVKNNIAECLTAISDEELYKKQFPEDPVSWAETILCDDDESKLNIKGMWKKARQARFEHGEKP